MKKISKNLQNILDNLKACPVGFELRTAGRYHKKINDEIWDNGTNQYPVIELAELLLDEAREEARYSRALRNAHSVLNGVRF